MVGGSNRPLHQLKQVTPNALDNSLLFSSESFENATIVFCIGHWLKFITSTAGERKNKKKKRGEKEHTNLFMIENKY